MTTRAADIRTSTCSGDLTASRTEAALDIESHEHVGSA
jgi:hypothetical protein